jgi:hypothetical protein
MTIKVLNLDSWMKIDSWGFDDCIETYDEIEPEFNRNGQYYDTLRKFWWFESDGRAWTRFYTESYQQPVADQFLWVLEHLNVVPLSKREEDEFRRITRRTADRVLRRHLQKRIHENDSAMLVQYGGTLHQRLSQFKSMKDMRARLAMFKEERGL